MSMPTALDNTISRRGSTRVYSRIWLLMYCSRLAVVLLLLAGCVTKSKAKAQAREAFVAGQNQALMRMQQSQPSVTMVGEFRNPVVPWTEDLTLAKALVAADYYGRVTPHEIFLVRQGRATSIEPKALLNGQDVPLAPGDIIQIRN
jgi:hypothetical protein